MDSLISEDLRSSHKSGPPLGVRSTAAMLVWKRGIMASVFGQFCPVALASEVLTPKWTLLVIRELNAGATRFNEIKRGVPRISATLLKQRLDQLEYAGIVERHPRSATTIPMR